MREGQSPGRRAQDADVAQVLVVAHAVATLALCGLTWTVAVVVYPGFVEAGEVTDTAGWQRIHAAHSRRMVWAVGPLWLVEGLAVAGLLVERPAAVPFGLILVAAVTGAATVALTVLRAVPLHERLTPGFDPTLVGALRWAHGWRSLAWAIAAADGVAMALMA